MKNSLRIWVIGSVVAIVALLTGGWFLGAQPFLNAAASASASADQLSAQNQASRLTLASLATKAAHIGDLKVEEQTARTAVPATLDSNVFVERINAIAERPEVNVSVVSVTPGTAQPYAPPASMQAAMQAAEAAASASASAGASPSPSATPTPAAAAPAAAVPALAATDPSITASNLTVVPISVSVKGSMEGTLRFTHQLQHDSRLFLVSGYTLSTDGQSGGKVLATLSGYIYALSQQ